jgi:hypothetical protein
MVYFVGPVHPNFRPDCPTHFLRIRSRVLCSQACVSSWYLLLAPEGVALCRNYAVAVAATFDSRIRTPTVEQFFVRFLLGNSPASEFYMSTFRNTLFHLHRRISMKNSAYEDGTECSETSTYKIQTPGNYPEESVQHSEHGESLKSREQFLSYVEWPDCPHLTHRLKQRCVVWLAAVDSPSPGMFHLAPCADGTCSVGAKVFLCSTTPLSSAAVP